MAPDTGRSFRRNWRQVVFILLPFLRVFRLIRAAWFLRTDERAAAQATS